jgi:ATP-dependent DNA helicase RecG
LHYVFAKMKLAEERGLGLKSMREAAAKAGLPMPRYSWASPYLTLTFYRSAEAMATELADDSSKRLSKSEQAGWEWISTRETFTANEYASAMSFPGRTAANHLKRFYERGLIERIGSGRSTFYRVVKG